MAWYYVKQGMIEDETVGPLDDDRFFAEVEDGQHKPAATVNHAQHTQGQWLELKNVPVLVKHFKLGRRRREQELLQQQQEKQHAAEARAKQREADSQHRAAEAEQRRQQQAAEAAQRDEQKAAVAFQAETKQVFDRYWMPSYLHSIWIVSLVLCGLAIGGTLLISLISVLMALMAGAEFALSAAVAVVLPCLIVVLVGLFYLVMIRLTLETFAIIFDIRALLKKQEHHMQQQFNHDNPNDRDRV